MDEVLLDPEDEHYRTKCRITHDGYVEISATKQRLHRILLNAPQDKAVDHKNNNKLDNRKDNLRFATQTENMFNRSRNKTRRSSQYKGVTKTEYGTWRVRIRVFGYKSSVGTFDTEVEAAKAYDKAAKFYFGEFAKLNFQE